MLKTSAETKRSKRSRRAREGGGAAVEFAIVLPLFCAVLFGMIDYGWYYYERFTLAAAVRDGVRYGVTVAVASDPWTTAQNRVKADLAAAGSPINPTSVSWGPSTNKISTIAGATPPNEFLTLSASVTFTPLVGFIHYLPATLSSQVTMLLEVQ